MRKIYKFIKEKSEEFKWIAYYEFIWFFLILWIWHYLNWQYKYQIDKLYHLSISFIFSISLYLFFLFLLKRTFKNLDKELNINSKKFIILLFVIFMWIWKEFFDMIVWKRFELMDLMFNYSWVAISFFIIDSFNFLLSKIRKNNIK